MTEAPEKEFNKPLGIVVGGSLTDGVEVRLDSGSSTEDVKVGTFVVITGSRMRFFGVVTDISLGTSDPTITVNPPDVSNSYIAEVVSGTAAFGTITVEPMLTLADPDDPTVILEGPQPAKTVPAHFSRVTPASERDI